MAKIRKFHESVNFYDLNCNFKVSKIPSISFFKFKGTLHISKSIHNGDIPLKDVEKDQTELKKDLGHIKHRHPRDKSEEQKKTIDNIKNLYKSREQVVQNFNDYAKNMSKNIYKSKQVTGIKIITPKQMLR